jgi:hypothetical protein
MSIDRETFERASEEELTDLSTPQQVLAFLAANRDRAFKAAEIASQLELDTDAVSTALTRLKERSLVEHKGTYWAITADESRLQESEGYDRGTAALNAQLGVEDETEWRAHAPDRPHPNEGGTE